MPLIPPYQLGPMVLQIHRTVIPNVCEGSLNRVNRDFFGAYPQQHVSRSFDMTRKAENAVSITRAAICRAYHRLECCRLGCEKRVLSNALHITKRALVITRALFVLVIKLFYSVISPSRLLPMRRRTSSVGKFLPIRYMSLVSAASTVESLPLMTPASSSCRPVSYRSM